MPREGLVRKELGVMQQDRVAVTREESRSSAGTAVGRKQSNGGPTRLPFDRVRYRSTRTRGGRWIGARQAREQMYVRDI